MNAYYNRDASVSANVLQKLFTINIIDPCESPTSLTSELDPSAPLTIYDYTIEYEARIETFNPFTVEPDWCEISFEYELEDAGGQPVIQDFNADTSTFIFEHSGDLGPLNN